MKPPAHVKIIFTGVFGAAGAEYEEWSFGLSVSPGSLFAGNDGDVGQTMNSVIDAILAESGRLTGALQTGTRWTRIRVVEVGDDGKYRRTAEGGYRMVDRDLNLSGSGTHRYPPQVAAAVTLDTGFAGPTGKGRFFIPTPNLAIEAATGTASASATGLFLEGLRIFLSNLQDATFLGWTGTLVVASGGSAVRNLPPALHQVESMTVGRVLDTIRSRRGGIPEDYVTPVIV